MMTSSKIELLPLMHGAARMVFIPPDELRTFALLANCPACSAQAAWRSLAALGGESIAESLQLVSCLQCGHITYNRLPLDEWFEEFYALTWDRRGRDTLEPVRRIVRQLRFGYPYRPTNKSHWSHVAALGFSSDARILDFGCGFGTGVVGLQALGYVNVFGVEPSVHRASVAAQQLGSRVIRGSVDAAAALANHHGPFDLIVARHVFEHLRDPTDVLTGLVRLLKPTGICLIIVPALFSESPVVTTLFFPHLHSYSEISLSLLMTRAGLTPRVWNSGSSELVVAGSLRQNWNAGNGFRIPLIEPGDRVSEAAVEFVAAPWRNTKAGTNYISYFPPSGQNGAGAGFRELNGSAARLAALGSRIRRLAFAIPKASGERLMLRLFQVYSSLSRSTSFPSQSSGSVGVVSYTRCGSCEIPWLVAKSVEAPVLVK